MTERAEVSAFWKTFQHIICMFSKLKLIFPARLQTREAVKDFDISDEKLYEMTKKFSAAVKEGLSKDGHATSTVKCYQTYVQDFPTGDGMKRALH